jgi:hypothetical protein
MERAYQTRTTLRSRGSLLRPWPCQFKHHSAHCSSLRNSYGRTNVCVRPRTAPSRSRPTREGTDRPAAWRRVLNGRSIPSAVKSGARGRVFKAALAPLACELPSSSSVAIFISNAQLTRALSSPSRSSSTRWVGVQLNQKLPPPSDIDFASVFATRCIWRCSLRTSTLASFRHSSVAREGLLRCKSEIALRS